MDSNPLLSRLEVEAAATSKSADANSPAAMHLAADLAAEVRELLGTVADLTEALREQQSGRARLLSQLNALTEQRDSARGRCSELEARVARLQTQQEELERLRDEWSVAVHDLSECQRSNDRLARKVDSLEAENNHFHAQLREAHRRMEELRGVGDETDRLRGQLGESRRESDILRRAIRELTASRDMMCDRVTELEAELSEQVTHRRELEQNCVELQEESRNLENRLEATTSRLEALRTDRVRLAIRHQELQAENARLRQLEHDSRDQLNDLRNRSHEYHQLVGGVREALREVRTALNGALPEEEREDTIEAAA